MRTYLKLQASLMETEERRLCPTLARNVVVSKADAKRLLEVAPDSRVTVIPNGVNTNEFKPRGESSVDRGILFLGGYDWQPNRDAMCYFAENVLPMVRGRYPDLPVVWVGRTPPGIQATFLKRYGICLTGSVPDVRPYLAEAACCIVPLRTGGGTRLKILDAWAMGKPVVSTSVGCEGLEARDGVNIIIRDGAADFAAAICDLVSDSTLRHRIGQAARSTAESLYDWDVIGRAMLREYLSVLETE
jgi:glycosyltransferase involved in cell wall biosynthesis